MCIYFDIIDGKPVDVITVTERLKERGTFEAVGVNEHLTNLIYNKH